MTALGTGPPSYDPAYFEPLFKIEDRHFWFRARNRIIGRVVNQLTANLPEGFRVLEVGCGTGTVLRALAEACPRGRCVGMDLFGQGLTFAQRRTKCVLVRGDIMQPPLRGCFDVVGLFDLLEHLPDDVGILRGLRRVLAPGGAVVLTVPAGMGLWSYTDEAARHRRRYGSTQLKETLRTAGYGVEYVTHFMAPLLPLVWIGRRLHALVAQRGARKAVAPTALAVRELRVVPVVNEALALALAPEAWIVGGRRGIPFGTSLLAVARAAEADL